MGRVYSRDADKAALLRVVDGANDVMDRRLGCSSGACALLWLPLRRLPRGALRAQCCNLTPNSVLIRYFVPLVAKRLYQRAQLLQIMLHMYPASLKARLARDSAPIHQLQRVLRSHQRQLCERVIEAVSAARKLSCGVCHRGRL